MGETNKNSTKYFSWTEKSEMGDFMLINKSKLEMDARYQRSQSGISKIKRIAKDWDWRLFGTISVVQRKNDTFWVYDGGHRVKASLLRKDILELPCMVFNKMTLSSEAKAFVGTNILKSSVSAYHKFRASLIAGEPISLRMQSILDKFGYAAARNTQAPYKLSAIATLRRCVKIDYQRAEAMFGLCSEIAINGEQFPQPVMGGIFDLIGKTDILSTTWREKLIEAGIPILNASIKKEKIIHGRSGVRIEGIAIRNFLNKGRKKKLHYFNGDKMKT